MEVLGDGGGGSERIKFALWVLLAPSSIRRHLCTLMTISTHLFCRPLCTACCQHIQDVCGVDADSVVLITSSDLSAVDALAMLQLQAFDCIM
jgi:hypothetical protein